MNPMVLRSAFFSLCALAAAPAIAQDAYPTKPVRIVVPYPAGGVADLLPRMVGEKLSQKWGQPVLIENKAGASGNIGMAYVAQQPADGYTFALAPAGNLTVNPTLFSNLPFDTARDFTPVTLLANVPNVLVVHPSVPVKTFQEPSPMRRRIRKAQLRLSRSGKRGAPRRRAARARRRAQAHARSLQGPGTRGDGSARRPGADDVRGRLDHRPVREGRQAARARDRGPAPARGASGRAHCRRRAAIPAST